MKSKITLSLADDHEIVRHGILSLLKSQKHIKVMFDVSNGQELMDSLQNETPDIILLDIDMPVMNGRDALTRISTLYPEIKVIMLTQHFNEIMIVEYIANGARAFLPKNCGLDEILNAIQEVFVVGHYYSEAVAKVLCAEVASSFSRERQKAKVRFTSREIEVLELLRQNKTNIEISGLLGIETRTVEGHRSHLMQKTGSKNLAALIMYSLQNNLIPQIPAQVPTNQVKLRD